MREKLVYLSTIYSEEFYRGMWKERPWRRCPQHTRKPLKRFDPNFICLRRFLWGVFYGALPQTPPREWFPWNPICLRRFILIYLFRRNDSFCKSGCRGMIPLPGFLGTASLRKAFTIPWFPSLTHGRFFVSPRHSPAASQSLRWHKSPLYDPCRQSSRQSSAGKYPIASGNRLNLKIIHQPIAK